MATYDLPYQESLVPTLDYVTPAEKRAALLPWLQRGQESFFEYGLRAELTKKRLIASGIPYSIWADGLPDIEEKLNLIDKIKDLPFFKRALILGELSDAEICKLADTSHKKMQTEAGHEIYTNRQVRRRIRSEKRQCFEQMAHCLGLVGKDKKWIRCSLFNQIERDEQNARNERALDKMHIKTADGSKIKISDLQNKAKIAKAKEIYCLLLGIEKIAREQGMKWAMITFTASPSHHPSSKTFAGNKMTEALAEIHDKKRNIWREFNRLGIQVSGCSATEFHKDGCPHDHSVIFYRPEDEAQIKDAISKRFTLTHKKDEHGYEGMPTANWMQGDSQKSKPASYALKYAVKSMFNNQNEPTKEMKELDTLYSTWNFRRFNFFGLPSMTSWREARKIKEEQIPVGMPIIKKAAELAKTNQSDEFIKLLGGLGIKNSKRPAKFSIKDRGEIGREIILKEKINNEWESYSIIREKMQVFGRKTTKPKDPKALEAPETEGRAVTSNYSREEQNQTQNQAPATENAAPKPPEDRKIIDDPDEFFWNTIEKTQLLIEFINNGVFTSTPDYKGQPIDQQHPAWIHHFDSVSIH